MATRNGHLKAARPLLQRKADNNTQDSVNRISVNRAFEKANPNVPQLFPERNVDVNARDKGHFFTVDHTVGNLRSHAC